MADLYENIHVISGTQPSEESRQLSTRACWTSLFYFTRVMHAPTIVFAVLSSTSSGLLGPTFAIFLGKLFNSFTNSSSGAIPTSQLKQEVSENCFILVGLAVASWVLKGIHYCSWIIFGELQAKSAREMIFEKFRVHELAWYDARKGGIGVFLVQIERQTRDLKIATSQPLGISLQFFVQLLAALALALYTSPKLALVTLAGVPIFMIIIIFFSSRLQPLIKQQQNELVYASKIAHDSISGIDIVKCFNAQSFKYWQYSSSIRIAARWYMRQSLFNSLRISFNQLMMFSMFIQGFWYGSVLVRSSEISGGDVIRTFWACMTATQSLAQILSNSSTLERGKVAGASLKTTLEENESTHSMITTTGSYPRETRVCRGEVSIENVSFAYPSQPEILVLNSVNLHFAAGETAFIIGSSGSGKSTVGNLMSMFYSSFLGRISIDGISIRAIDLKWLRQHLTLVHQQSSLFYETLFQNIAFGQLDPSVVSAGLTKEMQAALRTANLHDVIQCLPQGLNTVIGPSNNLSGGQKQRVALARARIRNSSILILDECTNALDQSNRVTVMQEIRKWRKGKTTIIITHDFTQIAEDDFVYILENGKVVGSGYRKNLSLPSFTPIDIDEESLFHGNERSWLSSTHLEEGYIDCFPDHPTSDSHLLDTYLTPRHVLREEVLPLLPSPLEQARLRSHEDTFILQENMKLESKYAAQITSLHGRSWAIQAGSRSEPERSNSINERSRDRAPGLQSTAIKYKIHDREQDVNYNISRFSLAKILQNVVGSLSPKKRTFLVVGFSCAVLHGSAYPIFSYLLSRLLETFYARDYQADQVRKWPLSIIGVGVLDALASFLMNHLLEGCGQCWVDTMRKEATARLLDQPRSWFDQRGNDANHLSPVLDRNAEETRDIIGRFVGYILVVVTTLSLAVIWSLSICWKLTMVIVGCVPVMVTITTVFQRISENWESRCNQANETIGSVFVETFTDIRTVKTFTLESYFRSKLDEKLREAWKLGLRRGLFAGVFFGLSQSLVFFLSALLFYYGAVLVASNQVTIPNMFTVLAVILFSIGYASLLLSWIPQYASACDTASHLIRLSSLPAGRSHENHGRLRVFDPLPIRFNHVYFRYPSRSATLVLRDLCLTIQHRTCTALVGPSGCGKSTIASLLLKLYPVTSGNRDGYGGTITLAGIDIRNLHVSSLRSRICIVPQQPQIFTDTILNNIAYGLNSLSPMASLANIRAAAKVAGIDDFISSLPDGYTTLIGDGGVGLSGGQVQRMVIARALVRQPQVLILDEATSSLDPENAKLIRQSVQELVCRRGDLTVIMITHDPQMMQMADRVVVIHQGTVVEEGAYDVLRRRRGGRLSQMLATGDVEGGLSSSSRETLGRRTTGAERR